METDLSVGTDLFSAELSPRLRLMLLANAHRFAAIVRVAAELGVADRLAGGPLPVRELAAACGAHEQALARILRGGALLGLFREVEPDCFELTPVSEGLRTDLPDSVRDAVLLDGAPMFWLPLGQLTHSARTGKPAFDAVFGDPFWSYVDNDAESGAVFDRAMTTMSRRLGRMYLDAFDFGTFERVADIGGGQGWFLGELLRRNPHARGVLFDRPAVVGHGRELELGEAADRVTVRPGDFFDGDLPTGCDTYLLKTVLHDWSDSDALRILAGVRAAAAPGSRLLVLEQVVAPMNEWDPAKFLDMDMLAIMGGRERTLPDWRSLFDRAGFDLVNEPVAGDWAVLECTVPCAARPAWPCWSTSGSGSAAACGAALRPR